MEGKSRKSEGLFSLAGLSQIIQPAAPDTPGSLLEMWSQAPPTSTELDSAKKGRWVYLMRFC